MVTVALASAMILTSTGGDAACDKVDQFHINEIINQKASRWHLSRYIMLENSQSEAIITVTKPQSANQRQLLQSPDLRQPIRGNYYSHQTSDSQSEAVITVTRPQTANQRLTVEQTFLHSTLSMF